MSDKLQGGVLAGSVDVSWGVVLRKSADSLEQTGKVAADMTLSYWRQGGTRTAVTASDLAAVNSAHSDGGVKEVDSTNMPGTYRVDWPDAAFATGADWVQIAVKVASTFIYNERIPLTTNVVQSGDSFARLGAPAGASIAADVAGVQSDTNDIQTRLPAALVGGRMDASVGAVVDGVLTAAKFAAGAFDAVWSVAGRLLTAGTNIVLAKGVGVTGFNDLDAAGVRAAAGMAAANLDAQLSGISSKTTNLPTDPADQSLIIAATDAIMTRLGAPAGASMSADIAGVQADTDNIQTRLPAALVGGRMDASVGAVNSDATAAANLAKTTRAIARGTVTTGATTTSIPTSAFTPAGAAADQFKGRIVTFDADTATVALRGQSTDITASSNSATPTLTVTALTSAPASGDTFSVT